MANFGSWDRSKPAGSDQLAQGDDQIRSDKSVLEETLNEEHIFESAAASAASAGIHRPGSSRISWGNAASVKTTRETGRLFYAVDENELHFTDPSGTTAIGKSSGALAVSTVTQEAAGQASRVTVEFDNEIFDTDGYFSPTTTRLTVPSEISGRIVRLDAQVGLNDESDITHNATLTITKSGNTDLADSTLRVETSGNHAGNVIALDQPIGGDFYEVSVRALSGVTISAGRDKTWFGITRT